MRTILYMLLFGAFLMLIQGLFIQKTYYSIFLRKDSFSPELVQVDTILNLSTKYGTYHKILGRIGPHFIEYTFDLGEEIVKRDSIHVWFSFSEGEQIILRRKKNDENFEFKPYKQKWMKVVIVNILPFFILLLITFKLRLSD